MIHKVLIIVILFFLFSISTSSLYALEVLGIQLPIPTPEVSGDPSSTPIATELPSPSVSASVNPSPSVSVLPVPSILPTILPTILPSFEPTQTPTSSPHATPVVGGPAVTQSPSPTITAAPTSAPAASPKTVETILRTETKTPKPIIQDIGDNAYSTLVDSPLSFLVGDTSQPYYHPHGLSQSSTNMLLILGFSSSLFGLLLIKLSSLYNLSTRLTGFLGSIA